VSLALAMQNVLQASPAVDVDLLYERLSVVLWVIAPLFFMLGGCIVAAFVAWSWVSRP
jgi:TRAP-type mannitol/chloroaromatic compound transport system permease small subunit